MAIISVTVRDKNGLTATATATADVTVPSAWPDATNTGVPAGTTLTNSGAITVSTPGTVIQNKNFTGTVTVSANNCTIKNCKISTTGFWGIRVLDGVGGTVIQDCEIDGKSNLDKAIRSGGASGNGTKILRCNIHHFTDGIDITGNDLLILDCWLHNPNFSGSGTPHYDVIVCDGSANNFVVRHNAADASGPSTRANSCISFNDYWGAIDKAWADNNLCIGPANVMMEFYGANHGNACTNGKSTNNRFRPGSGNLSITRITQATNLTWTGNVDDVTGAPINV